MRNFLALGAAVLFLICTLIGCAKDIHESSVSEPRTESLIESAEESSEKEHVEQPLEPGQEDEGGIASEQEDVNIDYVSYIEQLGYLLSSNGWDDVDKLSATDLVMWYADFERSNHADDKSYMVKYLVDGKDGFHLPQEELESTVERFFGISSDVLRTDNLVYSSVDEVYITPAALPMVSRTIALNEVVKNGNTLELYFDITVHGTTSSRVVTLQKNEDSIQFLSYEWVE